MVETVKGLRTALTQGWAEVEAKQLKPNIS